MKIKIFLTSFFVLFSLTAMAGSPNYVDKKESGKPLRWKDGVIKVYFDKKPLVSSTQTKTGVISNEEAVQMVIEMMNKWNEGAIRFGNSIDDNKKITGIHFEYAGLEGEITEENYVKYWFIESGAADKERHTVIIFDGDGKILEDMQKKKYLPAGNDLPLGLTDIFAVNDDDLSIYNGTIILNGIAAGENGKEFFKAVILHELGHLANLDHSSVNEECSNSGSCNGNDIEYIPTMYRWIISMSDDITQSEPIHVQTSLHEDDVITASWIYNYDKTTDSTIQKEYCRVIGEIRDEDGRQFQGAQIVAHEVGGEYYVIARSATSGSSFGACPAPPAEDQIGRFIIAGLRPGKDYQLSYGPIPDWCAELKISAADCSLGSGINPFVPPRPLGTGNIKPKGSEATYFKCEKGGDYMEAEPVYLEDVDLEEDRYRDYRPQLEVYCTPGVGRAPEPSVNPGGDNSNRIFKSGWCSLVANAAASAGILWILVPVGLLSFLRYRSKR